MSDIFTRDYRSTPYWWEDAPPPEGAPDGLPASVDVLVVGAGYAGICCALALAEAGVDVLVLDAGRIGGAASSRSGGQITGGVNVQKKAVAASGTGAEQTLRRAARLRDATTAMTWLEATIERFGIACGYHRTGRLTALWTPKHYPAWERRLPELNEITAAAAVMIPRDALAGEIGSTMYAGAALIGRAGHLHPAQLHLGLLAAARGAGACVHGMTQVESIERRAGHYLVRTARGDLRAGQVVLATNGHASAVTGELRRSVIPVTSHMIATEDLGPDLARSLIPNNRAVSETRRVVNHYRLSPDGRRLLFGGRARFVPTSEETTARLLHAAMLRRFPQLAGTRITHSWGGNVAMTLDQMPHIGGADGLNYVMGCNGSGVVMMSWLGHELGRKIAAGGREPVNAFDDGPMPRSRLYHGNPWFLFAIGTWYQFLDALDYRLAR